MKAEIRRVAFEDDTLGNTQRSLAALRDTLAQRAHHRLAVVEIPTSELCCGFFVLDMDAREAVFTGDGFRTDGGGEGGAGYQSAQALLDLYGLDPILWSPLQVNLYDPDRARVGEGLLREARRIAENLSPGEFVIPREKNPRYLR